MNQQDREKIVSAVEEYLDSELIRIIFSNPVSREELEKVKIRPLSVKGNLVFQAEEFRNHQAFHRNLAREECSRYAVSLMEQSMGQMELESAKGRLRILVSKKGTVSIKGKRVPAKITPSLPSLSHNRRKRYILEEGKPVPFLQDLGIMTSEGKVVASRYDKFRQINRFLEFIEDILPKLNQDRENVIIDFGCGKSYLTFAMYYYLHELKGYSIRIIGLDLKQAVIDRCNMLSKEYGYDGLAFYHGDIASYEGVNHVDMVVTLHACDTATDFAIYKAIQWDASVILSVPCCQHELNRQIHNDLMAPLFQYGIIKERMAALYTDSLRAELLENQGYRTQILEFIDMEHTPKNLLIRAVKQGKKKNNGRQIEDILSFLDTDQTLAKLLGYKKRS